MGVTSYELQVTSYEEGGTSTTLSSQRQKAEGGRQSFVFFVVKKINNDLWFFKSKI